MPYSPVSGVLNEHGGDRYSGCPNAEEGIMGKLYDNENFRGFMDRFSVAVTSRYVWLR